MATDCLHTHFMRGSVVIIGKPPDPSSIHKELIDTGLGTRPSSEFMSPHLALNILVAIGMEGHAWRHINNYCKN